MRIISHTRAVSTFMLIILLLCSAVFGALISYLLVISNYYNVPENTTLLIVEDAVFPIFDATYFNVTILNPSNSASDANITAIRLSVEGKTEIYNITVTSPEPLPFLIRRGTRLTFKCEENWSNFAGETVRIEPIAKNASTKSHSYTTPKVKLILTPNFDVSESVKYFDLTIENYAEFNVSLTILEIRVFGPSVNVTPALPYILSPNQTKTFRCDCNWENYRGENVTIAVKTAEGYESVYTTNELPGAVLYVDEVKFDYTDANYFNLTITSSEDSTASATITAVNLTLQDGRTIPINHTYPPLEPISGLVLKNQSRTFTCTWNWTEKQYRNETITVNAYTKEGFTIFNKTVKTPLAVIWNITYVKFDFDDVKHFLVNVKNMLCSLQNMNVTKIEFNQNLTIMNPASADLTVGEEETFNCTLGEEGAWNWTDFRGKNVTISVYTEDELNISKVLTVPSVGLKILGDTPVLGEAYNINQSSIGILYVNITVSNSVFSTHDVNITEIIFATENVTSVIDGTLTHPLLAPYPYVLGKGQTVTIVCPWNWILYLSEKLTVTLYTAEGFQVSKTWQIYE